MHNPKDKNFLNQSESDLLLNRAKEVIPGGIFGHYKYAVRKDGPKFFSQADGAYFWDVDGNEYVDLVCAWGPMILGYNNPVVDEAARKQLNLGNTVSIASPVMIELAETLVDLVSIADWSLFGKNGADSTSLAVMVSRQETGKQKILKINDGYHGSNSWMQRRNSPGIINSDSAEVISIDWNDLDGFNQAISDHGDDIACFISSPYHHPTFKNNVYPNEGYWKHIEKVCRKNNIILIVDDVRTGFRIDLKGSNNFFGFSPDLICLGKAIANGYPISALVGKDSLKESAENVYFTGTQFLNSAPMAAAKATIDELVKQDAVTKMNNFGNLLKERLVKIAEDFDIKMIVSGVPAMPYFRIEHEDKTLHSRWVDACLSKGLYLTDYHNHFISVAHEDEHLKKVEDIARSAFEAVKL